jgi:hypothetical protein
VVLAIAMLIVAQPVGVFWHYAHEHLDHFHGSTDAVAVDVGTSDVTDHEADHSHMWTIPAAAVFAPSVSEPPTIAALVPLEDLSKSSPAPFPPFPPPRA